MIINEKDLINLKSCAVKYKIGTTGYEVDKKSYNSFLNELFDYMVSYYHFHDKSTLVEAAEKKWADMYVNNLNIITEKKWLEGVGHILNIYNHLINEKFTTVDANVTYNLTFPDSHNSITGTINMIAQYGEQMIIIDPSFSSTEIDRHLLSCDIRYTIQSLAVKQMFNKTAVIKKHNYKTNKEAIAIRMDNHFKKLELIVKNASQIIEQDLIIPNYGYHCSTCQARGLCSGWGLEEIKPYNPFTDGKKR